MITDDDNIDNFMQPLNKVALNEIIEGNPMAYGWQRTSDGQYHVVTGWEVENPTANTLITNEDLFKIDPDLPEITELLANSAPSGFVHAHLLGKTYAKHWPRDNKVLEVQEGDEVYSEFLGKNKQPTWMVEQFVSIQRSHSGPELFEFKIGVYMLNTTHFGREYVVEVLDAWFLRPAAWLDQYIQGGEKLLGTLCALDIPAEEWASRINNIYLGQSEQRLARLDLPENLSFQTGL